MAVRKRKGTGMKGMSIKSGDKRPTKSGAGMTKKGVAKYRRQNPGSKLKTAVTEKKPTGKRATRRKSYCARSAGQMKKFPKAAKNPNSRLRQAPQSACRYPGRGGRRRRPSEPLPHFAPLWTKREELGDE